MQYYKRGESPDPEKHNIGKSPSFTVLNDARSTLLHHTTYNRSRELLNYSGCPENRFGSGSISGDYNCEYCITFPVRGKAGDKVKIGFTLTTWDNYDSSGGCAFQWDGVASPNLTDVGVVESNEQTSSSTSEGYNKPNGITVTDEIELDYDHNDVGGYGYVKVSFSRLIPASFVSWIRPIDEADYNAIDPTYGTQAFNLTESTFNIGQTLRGSSSHDDSNGSLGALCQRQFDDDDSGSNMVSNSELCMFNWGHPAGLFATNTVAGDVDIFGYDIVIKGRELLDSNTGYFDMVMLTRNTLFTEIKVVVSSTGTTHTYTPTLSTGVGTVFKAFSAVPFDPAGDRIRIYCNLDTSSESVEVKSIAIFESTY